MKVLASHSLISAPQGFMGKHCRTHCRWGQ